MNVPTIMYDHSRLSPYSRNIGHIRRLVQIFQMPRYLMIACAPPVAQRSRCDQSPFKVSGISIQHVAAGSKRMSQCAS